MQLQANVVTAGSGFLAYPPDWNQQVFDIFPFCTLTPSVHCSELSNNFVIKFLARQQMDFSQKDTITL